MRSLEVEALPGVSSPRPACCPPAACKAGHSHLPKPWSRLVCAAAKHKVPSSVFECPMGA